MTTDQVELKRGLRDVYFETTESSNVIGDIGRLIYRGYDIHDLAEHSSFEEPVFLMMHGHLPSQAEFDGARLVPRTALAIGYSSSPTPRSEIWPSELRYSSE